jgi:dTDP-4-amino-4,6-dideoxygalactose transaminase
MVAPVVEAGAEPLFYPVDRVGVPSLRWIGQQNLAQVKLLCVPHYFGIPQPMGHIAEFCRRHGIPLLEDCAHALFGESDGRPIGSWGEFAIASLAKFLPLSEGGLYRGHAPQGSTPLLPRRSVLDEVRSAVDILELAADHHQLGPLGRIVRWSVGAKRRLRTSRVVAATQRGGSPRYPSGFELGNVARGTRFNDLLLAFFDYEAIARRRRDNYTFLAEAFKGMTGARPLFPDLPPTAVPYVFPLYVDRADDVHGYLRSVGVPVLRWNWLWQPMPRLEDDCGIAIAYQTMQLPCHQSLTSSDLSQVVAHLRDALRAAG